MSVAYGDHMSELRDGQNDTQRRLERDGGERVHDQTGGFAVPGAAVTKATPVAFVTGRPDGEPAGLIE